MPELTIYYDNPTPPSDTYLKYLQADCGKCDIQTKVVTNYEDWTAEGHQHELYLEPTKDDRISALKNNSKNVDIPSATAQGIYNYITTNYPTREKVIMVIGRGLVGKQLLDMLINYGYTVFEFNSASKKHLLSSIAFAYADIIVGLATEEIFDQHFCDNWLNKKVLIDSGNNFNTKNKLRCGKWTRQVIVERAGIQV